MIIEASTMNKRKMFIAFISCIESSTAFITPMTTAWTSDMITTTILECWCLAPWTLCWPREIFSRFPFITNVSWQMPAHAKLAQYVFTRRILAAQIFINSIKQADQFMRMIWAKSELIFCLSSNCVLRNDMQPSRNQVCQLIIV